MYIEGGVGAWVFVVGVSGQTSLKLSVREGMSQQLNARESVNARMRCLSSQPVLMLSERDALQGVVVREKKREFYVTRS